MGPQTGCSGLPPTVHDWDKSSATTLQGQPTVVLTGTLLPTGAVDGPEGRVGHETRRGHESLRRGTHTPPV